MTNISQGVSRNIAAAKSLAIRLGHPAFRQPTDTNVKLWRYMDLPKLISLLTSQSLFMTRLDNFEDPYEGSQTAETVATLDVALKSMLGDKSGYHEISEFFKRNRQQVFVNCWHANPDESEAMWKLYSGHGGVAVQTTYAKLLDAVFHQHDVHIGMVQYIDYKTHNFKDANVYLPVMAKRRSFTHEQEIRLVKTLVAPEPAQHASISIEVDDLVEHVFVDPYAPAYYHDVVGSVLKHMRPALTDRLRWSTMKDAPLF